MAIRLGKSGWWRFLAAVVLAVAAGQARAGDLKSMDTALKFVPDDAALFSSTLRLKEQVEIVGHSKAWEKLKEMPLVQMGLALYNMQAANPESVPGKIQTALRSPDTRKLLALAKDMGSQEIFVYAGPGSVNFLELMQRLNGANRFGPVIAALQDKHLRGGDGELRGKIMFSALAQNPELIQIPDMLIGFKLSDTKQANEQLAKLEKRAQQAFDREPHLKGRLTKTKVAGNEYLTLSLDGKMIPWNELPMEKLKEMEMKPGDADKVINRIKALTLVVAMGVRDNYLLVSIGPSTAALARLGQGTPLADRPELKPLAQWADKRLTGIGYVSQAFSQRVSGGKKDIQDLADAVNKDILPAAKELTDQQRARISKDVQGFVADLGPYIPEAGAMVGCSFLTETGSEHYQYNYGKFLRLDSSKPLALLQHVGGDPILAIVSHQKTDPADYELLVKWVKVAYGYVQDFAMPKMAPKEREKTQKLLKDLIPLAQRLDKANRTMLLPALADGQSALVVDTKLSSKQYLNKLPATPKPLPMIQPALVMSVSKPDLIRKGCAEYRAVAQGVIDAIRKLEPKAIPADFKLPEPTVTKVKPGEISGFPLPREWGVDKQVVPNSGLSDRVAVMSLTRKQTERLMTPMPLVSMFDLAEANRPLTMAVVFNWAGLIDAITPWVDMAMDKATENNPGNENQVAMVSAQVHTVLDVLKVLQTVTSAAYLEGETLVTHTRVVFHDVAE